MPRKTLILYHAADDAFARSLVCAEQALGNVVLIAAEFVDTVDLVILVLSVDAANDDALTWAAGKAAKAGKLRVVLWRSLTIVPGFLDLRERDGRIFSSTVRVVPASGHFLKSAWNAAVDDALLP